MGNGQATASPVEVDGAGLPEILKTPQSVPEARAFYSGNPAFLDGADETPTSLGALDTIEFSVVADASSKNANGRQDGIVHALRYMRVLEEREPVDGIDFIVLDHGLVIKGLKWIRKHVDDEDIHMSTLKALKHVRPEPESEPVDSLPQAEVSIPPRSKNNQTEKKREEIKQEKLEAQKNHQAKRQSEIEELALWCGEEPPEITQRFFEHNELIETIVTPGGKIMSREKKELGPILKEYLSTLIYDPELLVKEVNEEAKVSDYLKNSDLKLLDGLYVEFNRIFAREYMELAYADADELEKGVLDWLPIFTSLSEEYKAKFGYDDPSKEPELLIEEKPASPDNRAHSLGVHIIYASFKKLAETDPKVFIDTVHKITHMFFDTKDEFVKVNFMHLMSTLMEKSAWAGLALINAPIATELDDEHQLKAVDFIMSLRQMSAYNKQAYLFGFSKEFRKYDRARKLVRQYGLFKQKNQNASLYKITAGPLMERVENGELENSLFLSTS